MTNKSLTTLKLNCNKFTFESYKPFKECLDKNATLSVFELNNCDMDQSREIELSEIITRKAIERKGQTFVSTPAIEKYMLDQRKALQVHEGSDEIVEEPQPAEGTKPPEKVAVNVADGEDKEKPDELKGSED